MTERGRERVEETQWKRYLRILKRKRQIDREIDLKIDSVIEGEKEVESVNEAAEER